MRVDDKTGRAVPKGSLMDLPPCEICGSPSVCGVNDLRETVNTTLWKTWEKEGPAHFYCEGHKRGSRMTLLTGEIDTDAMTRNMDALLWTEIRSNVLGGKW